MARTKEFDETETLDKAVDLFWEKGYHATSVQDVVDTLGISRSSLYASYGDKHALFLKALARYRCQTQAWLADQVKCATTSREALKALFHVNVGLKARGCLVGNSATELAAQDAPTREMVQASRADVASFFESIIREGQARGEISKRHEPASLSRFLLATLTGLQVASKAGMSQEELDEVVATALAVL